MHVTPEAKDKYIVTDPRAKLNAAINQTAVNVLHNIN